MEALALLPAEGLRAFQRILGGIGNGLVAVSTADLRRASEPGWTAGRAGGRRVGPCPCTRVPRSTPVRGPRNDAENPRWRGWWGELLGIRDLGVDDDFFASAAILSAIQAGRPGCGPGRRA